MGIWATSWKGFSYIRWLWLNMGSLEHHNTSLSNANEASDFISLTIAVSRHRPCCIHLNKFIAQLSKPIEHIPWPCQPHQCLRHTSQRREKQQDIPFIIRNLQHDRISSLPLPASKIHPLQQSHNCMFHRFGS